MLDIRDAVKDEWDVVVVGTGIGGATLGYALAKAGWRVLFCEKGRALRNDPETLRGDYAESFFGPPEVPRLKHRDILTRAGRCPEEIEDRSLPRPHRHIPFIGQGAGGSSALYGMAMERFFPADFRPRENFPQIEDSGLPERWPITYEQLRPYYEAAERLYRVRGTLDPLRPETTNSTLLSPPPLSPGNNKLMALLHDQGLHPYRLPLACEHLAGCPGCQGYLCPKECKNDSSRICLEPAISQYDACLLEQCSALRIDTQADRVTGVICSWRGGTITLRSKVVVLAAGALHTPALLLRSACSAWPDGVANESGLVGKNLMRHCIDLYAVSLKPQHDGNLKEIACNDFYRTEENKFGSVQSFGTLPPAPVLVAQLQQDLRRSAWPVLATLLKPVKNLLRAYFSRLSSRTLILASIMEDLPQRGNRVQTSERHDRLILRYRPHPHDTLRLTQFRQRITEVLKPHRFMLFKQAENNERIAHACGTCRFGTDPRESVLDGMNRAHGLSNLYVVDSSFFPSSAGTNPSLTIAANALRVADHIVQSHGQH